MIRNAYLILVFCVIANFNSNAQSFGINAGVLVSNYSVKSEGPPRDWMPYYNPKVGFSFGASGILDVSKKFDLECKILLQKLGAQFKPFGHKSESWINSYSHFNISREDKFVADLYYVSCPISMRYKLTNKLAFSIGPQIGYQITKKVKSYGNADPSQFDILYDSKYDLGITSGIAYMIKPQIGATLDAYHGFSKVQKSRDFISLEEIYNRNIYLSFSIQYYFKDKN